MDYKRFYAKIKLDNVEKNVACVRSRIPDECRIMAVVKADGYGHGAVELTSFLDDKVDAFGVATIDEAVELRRSGCLKPILILGATAPEEFENAVKYGVSVAITDVARAISLNEEALRQNKRASVHIKLDTGMARIGFEATDTSADEVKYISSLPNIYIEGLFSHFAKADERDKAVANKQLARFNEFIKKLDDRGVNIPVKHLSNSAGIMEMSCTFNMVRMGIMLYGLYPSDEMDRSYKLYPAMELISHISFVKTVPEGTGVSYGHTFVSQSEMKIATVPVGYADGYPRSLSGKGEVLVKGKRCPIVGRVCMDQLMIDISHIDEVKVGDEVVIVGKSLDDYMSVDEVSQKAGSFNYEFVCDVSRRVPRVYTYNDDIVKTVSYLDK